MGRPKYNGVLSDFQRRYISDRRYYIKKTGEKGNLENDLNTVENKADPGTSASTLKKMREEARALFALPLINERERKPKRKKRSGDIEEIDTEGEEAVDVPAPVPAATLDPQRFYLRHSNVQAREHMTRASEFIVPQHIPDILDAALYGLFDVFAPAQADMLDELNARMGGKGVVIRDQFANYLITQLRYVPVHVPPQHRAGMVLRNISKFMARFMSDDFQVGIISLMTAVCHHMPPHLQKSVTYIVPFMSFVNCILLHTNMLALGEDRVIAMVIDNIPWLELRTIPPDFNYNDLYP